MTLRDLQVAALRTQGPDGYRVAVMCTVTILGALIDGRSYSLEDMDTAYLAWIARWGHPNALNLVTFNQSLGLDVLGLDIPKDVVAWTVALALSCEETDCEGPENFE